jgi:hypothetical protein
VAVKPVGFITDTFTEAFLQKHALVHKSLTALQAAVPTFLIARRVKLGTAYIGIFRRG